MEYQEDARRVSPAAPDQAHRLRPDEHGLGRPRRARPWIAAAIGAALVVVFVVIMVTGGGENSEPGGGVVVEGP